MTVLTRFRSTAKIQRQVLSSDVDSRRRR